MDEKLASGLVVGATLAAVGFIGSLIWQVIRSPSESARRFRVVAGCALALLAAIVLFMGAGPIGFAVVVAIICAGVWIARGSKG